jgi:hypothetical protein
MDEMARRRMAESLMAQQGGGAEMQAPPPPMPQQQLDPMTVQTLVQMGLLQPEALQALSGGGR